MSAASRLWSRLVLIAAGGVLILAGNEVFRLALGSGNWLGRISAKWGAALLGFWLLFALLFAVLYFALFRPTRLARVRKIVMRLRDRTGWGSRAVAGFLILFPVWFLLYSRWGFLFTGLFFRLALFLVVLLCVQALIAGRNVALFGWENLLVSGVLVGSVFVVGNALVRVTDHPFTLYWSEGNRFWDYSLAYGRELYNYPPSEPINANIDPGRQSLWGLPFLLPSVGIEGMRLWNAILATLPYALFGWTALRLPGERRGMWFLFGLWMLTFLNQGPIYTPLVLSAILVAGVYRNRLWISVLILMLASYYAYTSRLTWMLAPAFWSVMLVFGDTAWNAERPKRWLWQRAAMFGGVGILSGWGLSEFLPRFLDNFREFVGPGDPGIQNAAEMLLEASNSTTLNRLTGLAGRAPLLWERLLPNASFGTGVLIGLLVASLPLILFLGYLWRTRRWKLDFWQTAAVVSPLAAFLIVGIIASVKIGGGLDLHNLDMFLIGLAFAAVMGWQAGVYKEIPALLERSAWARVLMTMIVCIPAFSPLVNATPLELPPQDKVDFALETIQVYVACANRHGEILFMDQRQLLTFHLVDRVPLVPEFEKKLVMDMALGGDTAYFEVFYNDLESGRFALIVLDSQPIEARDESYRLAAENNAWLEWVTVPLLKHYEKVQDFKLVGVELYMPIERSFSCP